MIKNITTLHLLRHGQLASTGLFCAKPEEALSKKGFQSLVDATTEGEWDVIITSPYNRCLSFAESLVAEKKCRLEINNNIREMDFGQWIGIPTDTLWQNEAEQLQQLWQSPDSFVAPQGESIKDFTERVERGLKDVLDANKNQLILMVTHAGVIRAILAKVLGISYVSAQKFSVDYATTSCVHYYADGNYSLQSHGLKVC